MTETELQVLDFEEFKQLEYIPATGCIVHKRVGKWGPYAYRVTKKKGKQDWYYLGKVLFDGSIRPPKRRKKRVGKKKEEVDEE